MICYTFQMTSLKKKPTTDAVLLIFANFLLKMAVLMILVSVSFSKGFNWSLMMHLAAFSSSVATISVFSTDTISILVLLVFFPCQCFV